MFSFLMISLFVGGHFVPDCNACTTRTIDDFYNIVDVSGLHVVVQLVNDPSNGTASKQVLICKAENSLVEEEVETVVGELKELLIRAPNASKSQRAKLRIIVELLANDYAAVVAREGSTMIVRGELQSSAKRVFGTVALVADNSQIVAKVGEVTGWVQALMNSGGTGDISVSGVAQNAVVTVKGTGRYFAGNLRTNVTEIHTQGLAELTIDASETISGVVRHGTTIVRYKNHPVITISKENARAVLQLASIF